MIALACWCRLPLRVGCPVCVLVIKIPGRKTYLNLNTMKNT